ncbi:MAG: hydroxyisourate hydrolase [Chloroflexi bacterium]|nr:MAG: hydroxyisourate hydrolase [Chloroflexota bacterium]
MTRATVSTHVLDVASGNPAAGVRVTLGTLAAQITNAEGRIADLSGGGIGPGTYQLVFEVDGYFGSRPHLFKKVVFELELAEARHYHVPLLISPFGLSSYRGT